MGAAPAGCQAAAARSGDGDELLHLPVAAGRVNAAVFRTAVEIEASQLRWRTCAIPFNTDSFFLTLAPGRSFPTADA